MSSQPAAAVPLGAVLAGGRSERMGRPKALERVAGRPLIEYPLATLAAAGLPVVVVAKPGSALPDLSVPVVREPERPRHPLVGILAALAAADGRPVVVLGCDMPLVPPALLAYLAALGAAAAAVAVDGRPEPLLARYDGRVAGALEEALRREAPLRDALGAIRPHLVAGAELERFGDPRRITFNVNRPEDLALAERMLAGRPPAAHPPRARSRPR